MMLSIRALFVALVLAVVTASAQAENLRAEDVMYFNSTVDSKCSYVATCTSGGTQGLCVSRSSGCCRGTFNSANLLASLIPFVLFCFALFCLFSLRSPNSAATMLHAPRPMEVERACKQPYANLRVAFLILAITVTARLISSAASRMAARLPEPK
jgi:hypothetical protein